MANVIDGAADRQMAHLRSFQSGQRSKLCQQLLNEISAARLLLLDQDKKAAYDAKLKRKLSVKLRAPRAISLKSAAVPAAPVQPPVSVVTLRQSPSDPHISVSSTHRQPRRKQSSPWIALGIGAIVLSVIVLGVIMVITMSEGSEDVASSKPSPKSKTTKSGKKSGGDANVRSSSGIANSKRVQSDNKSSATSVTESVDSETDFGKAGDDSTAAEEPDEDVPPDDDPVAADSPENTEDRSKVTEHVDPPANDHPPDKPRPIAKTAIPDNAALTESEAKIREIFDIEGTKTIEAKAKLARDMLATALESDKDRVSQFAMLRLVLDLAAKHGDYEAAERTIAEMNKRFEIDADVLRGEAMLKALVAKNSNQRRTVLSHRAMGLIADFHKTDRYDEADKVNAALLGTAKKLRDVALRDAVQDLRRDGFALAKHYAAIRPAIETLKGTPDDPAANTSVGRFLCYIKGDWDRGLALLAKGDDAKLRELSAREQRGADKVAEQLAVANAWWKVADEQPKSIASNVRSHAELLYRQTLPKLTGLDEVRVKGLLKSVDAANAKKIRWQPKLVNLALDGVYTRSAQENKNGAASKAFDGNYNTTEFGEYWFSGSQIPAWVRVVLPQPSRVFSIRLLIPDGTKLWPAGHEPIDYEILVEQDGKEIRIHQIRNGRGASRVVVNKKDGRTKFVTLQFRKPMVTSSIKLYVTRTSGKNRGPVVFEMEVLGIKRKL